MVMYFPGKTVCPLCNKIIESNDDIVGFPAFLPFDHKFGKFSDAVFHKPCFLADPDHEMADDMHIAYCLIMGSKPILNTLKEYEEWSKKAFEGWPPKNGVVILQPLFPEESGSFQDTFYMDLDDYNAMCEAEDKAQKELEERREEDRKRDQEALQYIRDDDY